VLHGRLEHFERLKVPLLGHSDAPYAALAREMNTAEGALKVAIHRLRRPILATWNPNSGFWRPR
jgi:hypothetical protein